jgi:hypothetical protein
MFQKPSDFRYKICMKDMQETIVGNSKWTDEKLLVV